MFHFSILKLFLLARREEKEIQRLRELKGTREERVQQLEDSGMQERYAEIFAAYVALAKRGDTEALKRSTYLWWCHTLNSIDRTGVAKLDPRMGDEIFALIEKKVSQTRLDQELQRMLPWYFVISKNFLPVLHKGRAPEPRTDFPRLEAYCRSGGTHKDVSSFAGLDIKGRGQMSWYWRAMCY